MPAEDCTHRDRKEATQGAVCSCGRHRDSDGADPVAVRGRSAHRARGNGPGVPWEPHRNDAVREKTTHRDRKGMIQGAVGSCGRDRDTDGANPVAVRGGSAHQARGNGPGEPWEGRWRRLGGIGMQNPWPPMAS